MEHYDVFVGLSTKFLWCGICFTKGFQQNLPQMVVVWVGRTETVFDFKVRGRRSRSLWLYLCELCVCDLFRYWTGILIKLATKCSWFQGKNWKGFRGWVVKIRVIRNPLTVCKFNVFQRFCFDYDWKCAYAVWWKRIHFDFVVLSISCLVVNFSAFGGFLRHSLVRILKLLSSVDLCTMPLPPSSFSCCMWPYDMWYSWILCRPNPCRHAAARNT